ncbi:MAG: D-alanyl-D-alanine dipeptidase [Betaproteobacteria bacterium]|nr:D-alanyl-D-alanine dipeptidase [Betaproteobacteria bacterium]
MELVAGDRRFAPLDALEGVTIDLRYAGSNNFAGIPLYDNIDCAWIHVDAFQALTLAAAHLRQINAPWSLLVLDALRPHRVQESIWKRVQGSHFEAYFADPALGSIHSYGMAVDLTLVDAEGCAADMGSEFDQMDELSHPILEKRHLDDGRLTSEHLGHRALLRSVMSFAGFRGIDTEWWHFDFGDRSMIRASYPRVV